jgi:hypothetical protein
MQGTPWSPPIVALGDDGIAGHLLCWEQHERDGSWHAWVSWIHSTGDPVRHRHKVVAVEAARLTPIEPPEAYAGVPRRVRGNDGRIRPWVPPGHDLCRQPQFMLDAVAPGREIAAGAPGNVVNMSHPGGYRMTPGAPDVKIRSSAEGTS